MTTWLRLHAHALAEALVRLARQPFASAISILVLGDAASAPAATLQSMRQARHLVVGPRASDGPLREADVLIDTGVAGIHESGTAVRMDDVPVPLSSAVAGPVAAASAIRALGDRVRLRLA